VLSTSPRDSLPREALSRRHRHQAERISSRIVVPESSLPPQPLSRNLPPDDLHSPFFLNPLTPSRATGSRYGTESAVPHSDEPIFRPVAIALYTTGARLRGEAEGEKKITGVEAGGSGVSESGLDKNPANRYACPNERAGAPELVARRTATVCDKIA